MKSVTNTVRNSQVEVRGGYLTAAVIWPIAGSQDSAELMAAWDEPQLRDFNAAHLTGPPMQWGPVAAGYQASVDPLGFSPVQGYLSIKVCWWEGRLMWMDGLMWEQNEGLLGRHFKLLRYVHYSAHKHEAYMRMRATGVGHHAQWHESHSNITDNEDISLDVIAAVFGAPLGGAGGAWGRVASIDEVGARNTWDFHSTPIIWVPREHYLTRELPDEPDGTCPSQAARRHLERYGDDHADHTTAFIDAAELPFSSWRRCDWLPWYTNDHCPSVELEVEEDGNILWHCYMTVHPALSFHDWARGISVPKPQSCTLRVAHVAPISVRMNGQLGGSNQPSTPDGRPRPDWVPVGGAPRGDDNPPI